MIAYRSIRSESSGSSKSYGISVIDNGVTIDYLGICSYMFENDTEFNTNVHIGNNVVNCVGIFYGCTNLNQNILIPNNITDCSYMFYNCANLNQPIVIPNGVVNCSNMFYNCENMSYDIIIPESVNNICNMLASSRNLYNLNVYVKGNTYRRIYTTNAFNNLKSNPKRINVYFNAVLNNQFNTGSGWTNTTNGFYNSSRRIYCYYNYPG